MNVLVSGIKVYISIYLLSLSLSLSLSLECHFACKGPCTGSSAEDCVECREGFQNVSGHCKGK